MAGVRALDLRERARQAMTAKPTTWSIERVWSATTEDKTEQFRTVELSRFRAVVLLGAAGAGKTTEAARLADQERASGASVHECRLAEFAETSTQLADHLARLAEDANERTALYLDALDEAMIPARRCWLAIKHWVTGELQGTRALIRITCRSAVWPSALTQVIREFAGDQSFASALLHPLSDDDILTAAASHRIDPVAFLERIHRSGARSLAGQPLSLRMLIRLHQSRHGLPASQKDLFEKGLELLVSDPPERREIDTQNPISPPALLEAAERLACYMVLSGRETVHLGDELPPNQLSLHDLSGKVTPEELHAIGLSGISDSTSPASFRFGHRQFAEYLAGRRLARLPIHQARAFLAGPGGWNNGVAGPLRETAAFTAMFNADVADWIATRDPEVIGLSDVADSNLRRTATLALLDRFRSGDMTDAQLRPGVLDFKGLRYDDADADLRPLLTGREDGCDDLLECAIDLARSWKLSSLSDDFADLVLDSAAPLPMRVAAGYALRECGTGAARGRPKPLLIESLPEDEDDELKGIALSCIWPDQLSTPELLAALTARRRPSFFGAYESFLAELDTEEFTAAGHLVPALRWAKTQVSESGDTDLLHRIAMRIAQAALQELDDPVVARELTALLRHWGKHYTSPLAWLPENRLELRTTAELEEKAPLRNNLDARRRLIDLLVGVMETWEELLELEYSTPGLRNDADFLWLLGRARQEQRTMAARKNYLHLVWLLRWLDSPENFSAWLQVCDDEPVKSILGNQKSVDLSSEEATQLRNRWQLVANRPPQQEAAPLDPPPRDRVLRALGLAETKDIRCFKNLCMELTLEPTSTHYGSAERFLTKTPGWREANDKTRARIIEVAKTYLSVEGMASESSRDVSPSSFHVDVLGAMWLVLECEPDWFNSRPESWWRDWCWYIFRELIPDLAGEPSEPKKEIARLLNEKSPTAVCREILALASGQDSGHGGLLRSLLRLLLNEPNAELDESLCNMMRKGMLVEQDTGTVGEFILERAPEISIPVCLDILSAAVEGISETGVEQVAVSLLGARAGESWHGLKTFLCSVEERARKVLKRFAHEGKSTLFDSASTRQLGELTGILIELFPPDTDPDLEGAHVVTADESARTLRSRLISHLGSLEDAEAVAVLREIEHRFGARHPWLRRPRSEAERALRLSRWSPFPVDVVGSVLGAGTRRLVRSEDDVVDGIEYALEKYAVALRGDAGDSVEDLWNTAKGEAPTPKAEGHVSSKLCAAVRAYFREYAVAADREVEIHRRSVARDGGGEPGSEVDLLVQVAGCGTVSGDVIRVPVEVKLSSNDEAKTGIREQLADRYLRQLGASHGVYVVVWMSLSRPEVLQAHHRPKWQSMESAREDLRQEAERLSRERGICLRAVVVDGSLL